MQDKANKMTLGFITVQLISHDVVQMGAVAISRARQDIESSDIPKSSEIGDSQPIGILDAAVNNALQGVVSKLEVLVQIVDKTSKVTFLWVGL